MGTHKQKTRRELLQEIDELKRRLFEAEETIQAIHEGEVDAIVVAGKKGEQVFSLFGAESIYRLIVETMKEAAFTVTFAGRILYCNPQFSQFVQKPIEQIIGRSLDEFISEADRKSACSMLEAVRNHSVKQRLVFEAADGSRVPAHISASVLDQPDGMSICVVANDLTELENSTELIKELRHQQEALRESESRFKAVFLASHDAILLADDQAEIVDGNPAAEKLFGIPLKDLIGTHFERYLRSNARFDAAWSAFKKEGRFRGELKLLRPGGQVIHTEFASVANILPGRHLSVIQDISERKYAEKETERLLKAVQDEKDRLSALIDSIQDEVWFANEEGKLTLVNRAVIEEFGESIVGQKDAQEVAASFEVYRPDGTPRPPLEAPPLRALRGETVRNQEEIVRIPVKGELRYRQVSAAPVKNSGGRIIGSVSVARDITERKRRETNALFLAEISEDLSRLTTADEIMQTVGAKTCAYLKVQTCSFCEVDDTRDEITVTAGWRDTAVPDLNRTFRMSEYCSEEFKRCSRMGETIAIRDTQTDPRTEARAYALQNILSLLSVPFLKNDEWTNSLAVTDSHARDWRQDEIELFQDLSHRIFPRIERARAQEALRQSEARLREINLDLEGKVQERTAELVQRAAQLRALAGELTLTEQRERKHLGHVLHDHLQQLLVAAKFRTAVLARGVDDPDKQAAREIEDLIDQSIIASRSLTAELSPPILHDGGLNDGLQWLARRVAERQGLFVDLDLDMEENEPLAEDLKILLFECVRELLFNIVKHAHTSAAAINLRYVDRSLQLTVLDEGTGFDPNVLPPPSELGGFGLFAIRERLELFGGKLKIESAPGHGSRIMLSVPITQTVAPLSARTAAAQTSSDAGEIIAPAPATKVRVLLADDHRIVRQGIANLIKDEADIEVVGEAGDGQEAVELAVKLMPDVILMDMSMPRLNGVEAARVIHNDFPKIRIIGLSMYEEAERAQAMRDAGAVAYLAKSGPAEELLKAIRKSVRRSMKSRSAGRLS